MYTETGNWLALEVHHLAFARALWDRDFAPEHWYRAYLRARFGAAAPFMRQYFDKTTSVSLQGLIPQSATGSPMSFASVLEEARTALEAARNHADTPMGRWVIDRIDWQPDYLAAALKARSAMLSKDHTSITLALKEMKALGESHCNDGTFIGTSVVRE